MTTNIDPGPRVTVVIPVFNSATTLARAIASATAQTLRDIEILIFDDKSRDNSLEIARLAERQDARVKVIALEKNEGKAKAMNHAAAIARGQWLAVLDADDSYLPDRLAVMVEAGEANRMDLVADNQLHIDDATGLLVRRAFDAAGPGREVSLSDFIAHSDPGANFDFGILKTMIRTSFLKLSGLAYNERAKLAEDFYYLLEFFTKGGRGWIVHKPLYLWTLPFSPSARRWTSTGNGQWRYDYRNALEVNKSYQQKLADQPAVVKALLQQREREYRVMVHYLDAQRILAEKGSRWKAFMIIGGHPGTWPLLLRRIIGRISRSIAGQRSISESKA